MGGFPLGGVGVALGRPDGLRLPCELDVWAALPEHEFYCRERETPADLECFAEGEPLLRMMTRVDITSAHVELERCGDDPLTLARQQLKEAVRGLEIERETLNWKSNYLAMPEHRGVKEPGWRSKVWFFMKVWDRNVRDGHWLWPKREHREKELGPRWEAQVPAWLARGLLQQDCRSPCRSWVKPHTARFTALSTALIEASSMLVSVPAPQTSLPVAVLIWMKARALAPVPLERLCSR